VFAEHTQIRISPASHPDHPLLPQGYTAIYLQDFIYKALSEKKF
jgi:hypothetical protein